MWSGETGYQNLLVLSGDLGQWIYWYIIGLGNITMSTPLGYDPGNFYVWRASDDFAIHLSLQVVTQLNAQISRAGNESQSGGLRGILIGRTIETPIRATVIEDFKLLPPSEDPGNFDSDDALFEIACRMVEVGHEQRPLGFFRTRRDGTLNMGRRDLETFSRLFCETGNVALLIQTSSRGHESDAALFYWQHGGAYPRDFGFGFPLEAGQLASGHPGWRYADPLRAPKPEPQTVREPPAPERPTPAPAPFFAAREHVRWSRLWPTAALVVLGIGALQLATNSKQTVSAADGQQTVSSADDTQTASAPDSNQTSLGLTATPREHQLEIRWNPQSAAIAASKNGVMSITEGETTEAVPFDQAQLRDGFVAYGPATSEVTVSLQVTGQDGGTTSESIRSVASP